jgi:hypothetical protein
MSTLREAFDVVWASLDPATASRLREAHPAVDAAAPRDQRGVLFCHRFRWVSGEVTERVDFFLSAGRLAAYRPTGERLA